MDGTPSVTGPGENSIYQKKSAAYISFKDLVLMSWNAVIERILSSKLIFLSFDIEIRKHFDIKSI